MLRLLKTVRVAFLIIAIWQFLGLLPVFPWLFQLPGLVDAAGVGSVLAKVLLKLVVAALSLTIFYALRPIQRKLEVQKEVQELSPSTAIPARQLRAFNLKFIPAVVLIVFGVTVITNILGTDSPKSPSNSYAAKCTSGLEALQGREPSWKGYSAYRVAQTLAQNFPPEEKDSATRKYIGMLQECRWTKVTRASGVVYYIDRSTIRLLAGGRRVAAFLEDYDAPRKRDETTDGEKYWSLAEVVLVGCQDMGTLVLQEKYMSLWFGLGVEVMRRGDWLGLEEYALAPLWPSKAGSVSGLMVQAACEIK